MRKAPLALALLPLLFGGCYTHFVFPNSTPEQFQLTYLVLAPSGDGGYAGARDWKNYRDIKNAASIVRDFTRLFTLGLWWPTAPKESVAVRPDGEGGTVLSVRVLQHTQLLWVIPIIWTDTELERRIVSRYTKIHGSYRER